MPRHVTACCEVPGHVTACSNPHHRETTEKLLEWVPMPRPCTQGIAGVPMPRLAVDRAIALTPNSPSRTGRMAVAAWGSPAMPSHRAIDACSCANMQARSEPWRGCFGSWVVVCGGLGLRSGQTNCGGVGLGSDKKELLQGQFEVC